MDLCSLLKEGGRYQVYHLSTSEGRRKASTAAIQFTATKKTRFEHMKVTISTTFTITTTMGAVRKLYMIWTELINYIVFLKWFYFIFWLANKVVPQHLQECFEPRQCPNFSSLQSPSFHSLCQEVDVVGYIIYISDRNGMLILSL